jgi:hypothetical protein
MTQKAIYQDANTFAAKWDRRLLYLFAAAGTAPSAQWTDPLKVQAKGSPTMHLDVLGGDCVIPCVAGTGNFTIDYGAIIYNNDATVDVEISPAHATYGRIDLVIVQLYDDGTAGGSKGLIEVVTGVASGSPAVPATPANAYKLAEIAVAATVTSITNANITDRRATTALKRSGGWIAADYAALSVGTAALAAGAVTPAKLDSTYKKLIQEQIIATAVQNVDFAGLTGYENFDFEITMFNAINAENVVTLLLNGDYTATNYYSEILLVTSTTPSSALINSGYLGSAIAQNQSAIITGEIRNTRSAAATFGLPRFTARCSCNAANASRNVLVAGAYVTAGQISSIRFCSDQASGFAIGSRIRVWGY